MRNQRLVMSQTIVFHQSIRAFQNSVGAAVVVFQTHGLCVREVLCEVDDVFNFRATPAVDGLVVVTNHADVAMRLYQGFDQLKLNTVGVLVFVNLQMVKL